MTAPADTTRCPGVAAVNGKPRPCCIRCERRLPAEHEPVRWHKWRPDQVEGEWVCEGQIEYAEGAER